VLSISLYTFSQSILKILHSAAQCVLRNVGEVFCNPSLELGKVCWSSLVHNALQMSKPNQSLQSYGPACVLRVQKELDCGAESHSGAETLFVQLSHCHHFGNTHSRQPHAPDRSTAPLHLNVRYYSTVWRFHPHLLYIYRAANINFKFSRFSALSKNYQTALNMEFTLRYSPYYHKW
jgi:hypothetical protein